MQRNLITMTGTDEAFTRLTQGLRFREETGKRATQLATGKRPGTSTQDTVNTNDPQEAANLVRKQHHIRVAGNGVADPVETFTSLQRIYKLPKALLQNLCTMGFKQPVPVQIQVLPLMLSKRDVIVISPTGSGKTLAFLLPIVAAFAQRKHSDNIAKGLHAILIAPGMELAAQTERVLVSLAAGLKLHATLMTKASAAGEDFSRVDAIVTTPLRMSRLLKRKKVQLTTVQYLVLDEADKLLAMGFVDQVDRIIAACTHPELVTGLFSATIPEAIETLAKSILKDPVRVTVGDRDTPAVSVQQQLRFTGSEEGKFLLLQQMLQAGMAAPVLIFVSSKEKAVILHRRLMASNVRVDSIFSSQDYEGRAKAMTDFRAGNTWLLISTDVLARGIDFIGVQTVLNYDCPETREAYIHRIGRAGRGQAGRAVTFFTEDDAPLLRPICHLLANAGQQVPQWMLEKSRQIAQQHKAGTKRKRTKETET